MKIKLATLRTLEKEKGIPVDKMSGLVARALRESYRSTAVLAQYARVEIGRETGSTIVFARERDGESNLVPKQDDTPEDFEHTATLTVRQTILSRPRDAESDRVFNEYADLSNQVISGVVQCDVYANGRGIVVVHTGSEANGRDDVLMPAKQLPGEELKHGDRIKYYAVGVNKAPRDVTTHLSRTYPELIRKLPEFEIPEVAGGAVELILIAHEAGHRTKVAVRSVVEGLNAKGVCIKPRGQCVSSIMNKLKGEKIDTIDYDEDPAKFTGNPLAPAKVVSVKILDVDERRAYAAVPGYQLFLAISKEGQDAHLTARLTGWRIDIHSDAE